ncbi:MAG TPA: hypothetical protein HPP83_03215 [Candidatus Hydrogenedentes bacterium]|nr:hypothetical protein [Candidatus Hydrogenedentota bacterium]
MKLTEHERQHIYDEAEAIRREFASLKGKGADTERRRAELRKRYEQLDRILVSARESEEAQAPAPPEHAEHAAEQMEIETVQAIEETEPAAAGPQGDAEPLPTEATVLDAGEDGAVHGVVEGAPQVAVQADIEEAGLEVPEVLAATVESEAEAATAEGVEPEARRALLEVVQTDSTDAASDETEPATAAIRTAPSASQAAAHKRDECPFCAEKIIREAQKCHFCGEWLPENWWGETPGRAMSSASGAAREGAPAYVAVILALVFAVVALLGFLKAGAWGSAAAGGGFIFWAALTYSVLKLLMPDQRKSARLGK